MAKQRHPPEQIMGKLREAEVDIANVGSVAAACKMIGVTEQGSHGGGQTIEAILGQKPRVPIQGGSRKLETHRRSFPAS